MNNKVVTYQKVLELAKDVDPGDPISPYLFFYGSDILALLILINPEIVGFKFKSCMYKFTQFADDTTLVLDGSLSLL